MWMYVNTALAGCRARTGISRADGARRAAEDRAGASAFPPRQPF